MKIITYIILLCAMIIGTQACKNADQSKTSQAATNDAARPANYYQEQHRNQYHFSPEANWMNDPNGMVYLDGEYHLFLLINQISY